MSDRYLIEEVRLLVDTHNDAEMALLRLATARLIVHEAGELLRVRFTEVVKTKPITTKSAVIQYLKDRKHEACVQDIHAAVCATSKTVPTSSIRSILSRGTPTTFVRTAPGRYILKAKRLHAAPR